MYEACLRKFRQILIFILIRNVKFPFVPYLLISMYACTCFNKSLQLFPIFVEQKMNDIKKWWVLSTVLYVDVSLFIIATLFGMENVLIKLTWRQ